MAVDLAGGLGGERELVFEAPPEDPEVRRPAHARVRDGGDDVGLPRIGAEAGTPLSHQETP